MLPHLFYGGFKLLGTNPEQSRLGAQSAMASEVGVRLFAVEMPMPWAKPDGQSDFSVCERFFSVLQKSVPDGNWYVRFSIMSPPWWNEQHPGHRMVFQDGPGEAANLASPVWRAEMLANLERFIDYCESHYGNRIAVYHFTGLQDGEWQYPKIWVGSYSGFDEHTRTAFRSWAEKRYGSLEKTGVAWGQEGLASETFRVPTVQERQRSGNGDFRSSSDQFVIDFNRFQNDLVAETMILVAETVKKKTGGRKLTAAFYGYLFEFGQVPNGPVASGHCALEKVLASPHIDILASPISYGDRVHDGISAFMTTVDSIALHRKLWVVEDDTRTFLCPPDSWPAKFGLLPTLDSTRDVLQRNFGQIVPRRLGLWHMDLIDDGWFESQQLWKHIAWLRTVYEKAAEDKKTFRPEVAVFLDPSSLFYLAGSNKISAPLLSVFRTQIYRLGSPVGFYLLSDLLEGRVDAAPMNLFLGTWSLDDRQRRALTAQLQDRTAVWFHGSGLMRDNVTGTNNMTDLTGFPFSVGRGSATVFLSKAGSLETEEFRPLAWRDVEPNQGAKAFAKDCELNPRWSVENMPDIEILARYSDGTTAVARREYHGFTSIYAGTLGLPANFLRELSSKAGAHIYLDSDDVVNADEHFLSVAASTSGEKAIRLPRPGKLIDIKTGAFFPADSSNTITLPFVAGECRFFRIDGGEKRANVPQIPPRPAVSSELLFGAQGENNFRSDGARYIVSPDLVTEVRDDSLPRSGGALGSFVIANPLAPDGKTAAAFRFRFGNVPLVTTCQAVLGIQGKAEGAGRNPSFTLWGVENAWMPDSISLANLPKKISRIGEVTVREDMDYALQIDVTEYLREHYRDGEVSFLLESRTPAGFSKAVKFTGHPSLCLAKQEQWPFEWEALLEPVWAGKRMIAETILPIGRDGASANLLFVPKKVLRVTGYSWGDSFEEGKDFELHGRKLLLPAGSRIPALTNEQIHPTVPKSPPGTMPAIGGGLLAYSEAPFFTGTQLLVSYEHESVWDGPLPQGGELFIPRSLSLLKEGKPFKLAILGDSISVGANASGFLGQAPFMPRWSQLVSMALNKKFRSRIDIFNPSLGGMNSDWGARMAESLVAAEKPDLTIIAFGMNDAGHGIPAERFITNLKAMMASVRRENPSAEFVLVMPFQPNSEWRKPDLMLEYLSAIQGVREEGVAVIDIWSLHGYLLQHKSYWDMTGNGVNHPNDFIARLYAQCLLQLLGYYDAR